MSTVWDIEKRLQQFQETLWASFDIFCVSTEQSVLSPECYDFGTGWEQQLAYGLRAIILTYMYHDDFYCCAVCHASITAARQHATCGQSINTLIHRSIQHTMS